MLQINRITIIGANGTMGRNVAAIFASFGAAKVYLVSRTMEKSIYARDNAYKTVKAESIKKNMIPLDYSSLEECVKNSDLIFEACAENYDVKLNIHSQISEIIKTQENNFKIICSGTSGLSITKLSEVYDDNTRSRFFGMHFFNPPYNMTLCELIPTDYTNKEVLQDVYKYLNNTLLRTTVITKDTPAFLGNRIGFCFINRLLQLAEEYKYSGGIDYIDAIFGPFTGRNMAPLITANFVGLDIHKAIVDNLYYSTDDYLHDDFILPDYVEKLINDGKLGRKTGAGLYRTVMHDNGTKIHQVYDLVHSTYRNVVKYSFPFVEEIVEALKIGEYKKSIDILIKNKSSEAKLCKDMLIEYVLYALNTADLVGENLDSADDVMATGFGWCPPLAMIEMFGGRESFEKLCYIHFTETNKVIPDFEKIMKKVSKSKYDYRKFVKAKR